VSALVSGVTTCFRFCQIRQRMKLGAATCIRAPLERLALLPDPAEDEAREG